jgi:hypothetical protein
MYVAPPHVPTSDEFDVLATALVSTQAVQEAWLAGWLTRTMEGDEQTDSVIAVVLDDVPDDPSRSERTRQTGEVVGALDPTVASLGLTIKHWAFVSPLAVEREIAPCGIRFYSRDERRP